MEARTEHPRAGLLTPGTPPRLVGLDLGTTNSAVAWVDAAAGALANVPRLFDIPQLVAFGELAAAPTLPSFLYLPTAEERGSGRLAMPWDPDPSCIAGVLARDHGSLVPGRLISSAKSWLSNPAIDRRGALLPWTPEHADRMSPVDASTRLLAHVRDAWNHVHAEPRLHLERQVIVLTVPASFDEEARELTVEAARGAGLEHLTLLEEPLAALYAWIAAHRRETRDRFRDGQLILVCDVGGGTTDFSLFRASAAEGDVQFERTTIGRHLLLGGDNVDVALAALVERKLREAAPAATAGLTVTQRHALRRQCGTAKERLLTEGGPDRVPIAALGAGRGIVGGTLATALTAADVAAVLQQFLPDTEPGDVPRRERRPALRELGLPYESDPAITRHLAAFLAHGAQVTGTTDGGGLVRPDAVLFNGGFFAPALARERILDALASWFGRRPDELRNDRPEAAVAMGAAYFADLRRDAEAARRHLVRAGSGRSYYVGVRNDAGGSGTTGVCVMPRGTQEGTHLPLDREFVTTTNEPAAFTLYSSTQRTDPLNAVVTFGEHEEVHRHAPLVTALRYGKRSRRTPLHVRLNTLFTEVGTLELWCESQTSEHRWRLQFNLREARPGDEPSTSHAAEPESASPQVVIPDASVQAAQQLIRTVFETGARGEAPDALVGDLENVLGHGKHAWPLPVIRALADALLATAPGRGASARHEARWLNLVGFCMRPGFGTTRDPWRVTELRKVYAAGLIHSKEVQNQVEWAIVWQRVSGGFTQTQQQELATRLIGALGLGARKGPHLNSQIIRESWRLLGNLERLDAAQRTKLGDELIVRIGRDSQNTAFLWAIGRFGARTPFYGPLNAVVPPAVAERWLSALLDLRTVGADTVAAAVQIGARTDDPARDISDAARAGALARLPAGSASPAALLPLRECVPPERLDALRVFGESLPEGLRLQSTASPGD